MVQKVKFYPKISVTEISSNGRFLFPLFLVIAYGFMGGGVPVANNALWVVVGAACTLIAVFCATSLADSFAPLEHTLPSRPQTRFSQPLVVYAFLGAAVLASANIGKLALPISGDPLAHASAAWYPFLRLPLELANHFAWPGSLKFLTVAQGLMIIYVLGVAVLASVVVIRPQYKSWLLPVLAVLGLTVAILGSGNADRHPPGRYLPLQATGAFIGLNAVSIRLPQLLCLVAIYVVVMVHMRKHVSLPIAVGTALAICTAPLVLHTGVLGEFSIWAICSHVLAFSTVMSNDRRRAPLILLAIASLSLIRISSVLGAVPVAVWLVTTAKNKEEVVTALRALALFAAVLLPQAFRLIVLGNPAVEISATDSSQPLMSRILEFALALPSSVAVSTDIETRLYLGFSVAVIFASTLRRDGRVLALCLGTWFIGYMLVLASVKSDFWGVGRYQAEWLPVVLFVGAVTATRLIKWRPRPLVVTMTILLAAAVILNLWRYQFLEERNLSLQELRARDTTRPFLTREGYYIKSEWRADFEGVVTELLKARSAHKVLLLGTVYGHVFPLVYAFSGVQPKELQAVFETSREIGHRSGPAPPRCAGDQRNCQRFKGPLLRNGRCCGTRE